MSTPDEILDEQIVKADRYHKHSHRCPNCGFWFECLEEECKYDYSACCADCE